MRSTMYEFIGVRVMSIFLLAASTVYCAPYLEVVDSSSSQGSFFTERPSKSLKTLLRNMNEYWFETIHFCGDSSDQIIKETCQMYYYGEMSPFRDEDILLNTSADRMKREATEDCCNRPCSRWFLIKFCNTNATYYDPTSKQPYTTLTKTTLAPTLTEAPTTSTTTSTTKAPTTSSTSTTESPVSTTSTTPYPTTTKTPDSTSVTITDSDSLGFRNIDPESIYTYPELDSIPSIVTETSYATPEETSYGGRLKKILKLIWLSIVNFINFLYNRLREKLYSVQ